MLAVYEEDLIDACEHLDADHVTRLAQAFYLLKSPNFDNIQWRVETRVNELVASKDSKEQLKSHHIVNVLRSFAHSKNNLTFGKDQTYYNLEAALLRCKGGLDGLNDRDFSHVAYAFGVRAVGNPDFLKLIDARIEKIGSTGEADYPTLFNLMYYMLFRESADKQLWKKLIKCTVNNKAIMPLIYYRPFKCAYVYLNGKFPELNKNEDFIDLQHKFFYAERYFNVIPLEENYSFSEEHLKFKAFLNTQCYLFPQLYVATRNLFVLQYVW